MTYDESIDVVDVVVDTVEVPKIESNTETTVSHRDSSALAGELLGEAAETLYTEMSRKLT